MKLEELRRLFCAKIALEYESIHEEMLSKEKEEIYDNAFYIDAVISIYECLLEMSQEMEQKGLAKKKKKTKRAGEMRRNDE